MKLRWSMAAASDLEGISNYLRLHHPALAAPTIFRIYDAAKSLKRLPERGRSGRLNGTRELVLAPLPYILLYSVREDSVNLLRILHGAQEWPGESA